MSKSFPRRKRVFRPLGDQLDWFHWETQHRRFMLKVFGVSRGRKKGGVT